MCIDYIMHQMVLCTKWSYGLIFLALYELHSVVSPPHPFSRTMDGEMTPVNPEMTDPQITTVETIITNDDLENDVVGEVIEAETYTDDFEVSSKRHHAWELTLN